MANDFPYGVLLLQVSPRIGDNRVQQEAGIEGGHFGHAGDVELDNVRTRFFLSVL
jgi:hypothetical protein